MGCIYPITSGSSIGLVYQNALTIDQMNEYVNTCEMESTSTIQALSMYMHMYACACVCVCVLYEPERGKCYRTIKGNTFQK